MRVLVGVGLLVLVFIVTIFFDYLRKNMGIPLDPIGNEFKLFEGDDSL